MKREILSKLDMYLLEINQTSYGEEKGKTTKDSGHDHEYFLDRISGDGSTSKDKGHQHKIKAMVVLKSKGHDHGLK